ncbi:muscarinic acetylcholine receptor M1-like [Erpetoichthys calabaricus]|uniref:muscarinic acetylcholine receptor M1-like n=1 Tax=Erpetoichthys calabaricus TaxID=27687 RepID=UPI00109F6EBD|nr:muscarinic acetylcholine receptor M1-like [Erpetoichthys calabaricus]
MCRKNKIQSKAAANVLGRTHQRDIIFCTEPESKMPQVTLPHTSPVMNLSMISTSLKPTLPPNFSLDDPLGGHTVWEVTLIVLFTGTLSLVTIIGNLLVMIAFKVNSHLKTVNNYFLLSLACADLILGAISMNLYTTYIIMGRWALGNLCCDIWLAIDYVASNASVMNLLIISFDRYFSVTRPLTYRAKRTPKRAAIMIGLAWAISFVLWAPAIIFWQYIVGSRTVPQDECYIQFLSQPIITFGTAIAAFYLPVSIMIILYWRIYKETRKRSKELKGLMGSESRDSTGQETQRISNSSTKSNSSWETTTTQAGENGNLQSPATLGKNTCWPFLKKTSYKSKISTNGSWINIEEEGSPENSTSSDEEESALEMKTICSAVGRVPLVQNESEDKTDSLDEEGKYRAKKEGHTGMTAVVDRNLSRVMNDSRNTATPSASKRSSQLTASSLNSLTAHCKAQAVAAKGKKRKNQSLIKEKKAAKTLSAILLAFILTWTPYNIMVLVSPFCKKCVPEKLWELGYWLCYINSTVNPVCYALCNEHFRVTFKMLLMCRWDKRKWGRPQRSAPSSLRGKTQSSSV